MFAVCVASVNARVLQSHHANMDDDAGGADVDDGAHDHRDDCGHHLGSSCSDTKSRASGCEFCRS